MSSRARAEIELPLANAMRQLDAKNRGRGPPEPFDPEHRVRSGLDVTMVLFAQIIEIFGDRTFVFSGSRPSVFISRTARCEAAIGLTPTS
jgi:hypothetical protein